MPTPARRMAQGRGSGPMWASAPTISRLFEIYPAGLFLQHGLDQLRNVSTRRPPCGWPHGAPKRLFYLLGQTKFARHQGFARRAKRLYARCAPRGGVRISPQINAAGLLLQHGLDQLRDMRARRSPCGWPHGAPPSVSFICSGELNSPGIKVLPAGQNACTRNARPVEAGGRISPQINAAGLFLQHGLDQLRNVRARLHRGGTLAVDVGDHRALGLRYADVGLVGQVG